MKWHTVFLFMSVVLSCGHAATNEELIAALKSDAVRWNAGDALRTLWFMESPPKRQLQKALYSTDYQQRQAAADVLRYRFPLETTDQLLKVSIEGLRDDRFPRNRKDHTYTYIFNASRGAVFLAKHAHAAREQLIRHLSSDDLQQRFLCAYALAMNGIQEDLGKTASVLLPHLRDNKIRKDACLASAALFRLGPGVKPQLLKALPAADTQQRALIELIILNLKEEPIELRDFYHRKTLQSISVTMHDPVYEGDLGTFCFPFGIDDASQQ